MKTFLLVLILVSLIIYIAYLKNRFSGREIISENNIIYFRERKFTEHSPIIWQFLLDKKVRKESIIATVLEYVKKGYINMSKIDKNDYEFEICKDLSKLNVLDRYIISTFFMGTEKEGKKQSLENFKLYMYAKQNLESNKTFMKDINNVVKKYLSSKKHIKIVSEKLNIKNIFLCCIIHIVSLNIALFTDKVDIMISLFSIIGFCFICSIIEKHNYSYLAHGIIFFMLSYSSPDININLILSFIIAILLFLLIYIDDKFVKISKSSDDICIKARGLKRYIKEFSKLKDKNLDAIHTWDEYYICSVAMGITKV